MNRKTIRDVELKGKHVLVRADFNVPVENGAVADDWRIESTLPTIRYLLDQGAAVVIMSHLGRPKGEPKPEFSLKPVAQALEDKLERPVTFVPDCVGDASLEQTQALQAGSVALLENTRFHKEEKDNDKDFSAALARHGDVLVDDAFAVSHRAHASNVGVAEHLPAIAGLLMEREVDALARIKDQPGKPYVAIFGGAKISGKAKTLERTAEKADWLLLGGGLANTALHARGLHVGQSLVDEESVDVLQDLMQRHGEKVVLPEDVVILRADDTQDAVPVDRIPSDARILDVGPRSIDRYLEYARTAANVVWNGPVGNFEQPPFDRGTLRLAEQLAQVAAKLYVGGGDTIRALAATAGTDAYEHVSTGGGAFLSFLAGEDLPGLQVIQTKGRRVA